MKHSSTLAIIVLCGILSSCSFAEDTIYPLLDRVTTTKNSQDIYARNDAYSENDTLCKDTALVNTAIKRKNFSTKWQYTISKPKVEWQRNNSEWLNNNSGATKYWLFITLVAISILGFWIPTSFYSIRTKQIRNKISSFENKGDKALENGDGEKADEYFGKCESLAKELERYASPSYWRNRIMPYVLGIMTLIEGIYLFLFNFDMPMLSPARYGFWIASLDMLLLALAVFTQFMLMHSYSEALAQANKSTSKIWFIPEKCILIFAIPLIILVNSYAAIIEAIMGIIGLLYLCFIFIKNKNAKSIESTIFSILILANCYIFLYFFSYVVLVILTAAIIVIGIIASTKVLTSSKGISTNNKKIHQKMQDNPQLSLSEACHTYYEEKKIQNNELKQTDIQN